MRSRLSEFQKREAVELGLPSTVTAKYGGDNEEINKTFTEMGLGLSWLVWRECFTGF